jgi:hypothetical protein
MQARMGIVAAGGGTLGLQRGGGERLLDCGGRSVDAVFLIGEQFNVLRRAPRQAGGQQSVAAAAREPVPGCGSQRDGPRCLSQRRVEAGRWCLSPGLLLMGPSACGAGSWQGACTVFALARQRALVRVVLFAVADRGCS